MFKVLITADHQEVNNPDRTLHGPYSNTADYECQPVYKSGYLPYVLPAIRFEQEVLEKILEPMDMVLITGGYDVNPILYGEELRQLNVKRYSFRDELDYRLIAAAIKMKKKVFGICRGAQILNVYFGGSLCQDLQNEFKQDFAHGQNTQDLSSLSHKINIETGSFLDKVYGEKQIWINSFHHQGVKKLGDGLKVAATANDGLIEAFEHESMPIYAVQWHPEISFHFDENSKKLFAAMERMAT